MKASSRAWLLFGGAFGLIAAMNAGCSEAAKNTVAEGAASEAAAVETTSKATAPPADSKAVKPNASPGQAQAQAKASPAAPAPGTPNAEPHPRQAAKPVVGDDAKAPQVLLSTGHTALCKVKTGEQFPAIELPRIGAEMTKLATFAGSKATVVLVWAPNHWMSRVALADIAKDIAAEARDATVGVIGIAVSPTAEAPQAEMTKTGAKFAQLLDADGAAFAQLGSAALPRVYVLNAEHQIVWFDIEYSEATRRELHQTLAALTAAK